MGIIKLNGVTPDSIVLNGVSPDKIMLNGENYIEESSGIFKPQYVIEDTSKYVSVTEYDRRYAKRNTEYAAVGAFYFALNQYTIALQPFCLISETMNAVQSYYYNFYNGDINAGGSVVVNGKRLYYSDTGGLMDNSSSNISIISANFTLNKLNTVNTYFGTYEDGVRALANAALK